MRNLALQLLVAAALVACGGGGSSSTNGSTNGSSGSNNPPPPSQPAEAVLSWEAPDQNADDTPLTDLAGYRVYVRTGSGSYGNPITIANPLATTYTVTGLTSGTHYFSVKAFDTSGNESAASDEVSKTIP